MGTAWKAVPGWPYEVSSDGEVRRIGAACGATVGTMLRTTPRTNGYLGVTLSRNSETCSVSVHALVCEIFHGPRPLGQQVRHLDGNKKNNAAANLAWGSAALNCADKLTHGTLLTGDRHPRTKVSESDYHSILQAWDEHPRGYGQTGKFIDTIMAKYGVSKGFVEDAIYGRVRAARVREERRAA